MKRVLFALVVLLQSGVASAQFWSANPQQGFADDYYGRNFATSPVSDVGPFNSYAPQYGSESGPNLSPFARDRANLPGVGTTAYSRASINRQQVTAYRVYFDGRQPIDAWGPAAVGASPGIVCHKDPLACCCQRLCDMVGRLLHCRPSCQEPGWFGHGGPVGYRGLGPDVCPHCQQMHEATAVPYESGYEVQRLPTEYEPAPGGFEVDAPSLPESEYYDLPLHGNST